jgi:hypothetical protein
VRYGVDPSTGNVGNSLTDNMVRGMRKKITSYDNATVGSGSVINEIQFAYNDFGQITHDYQANGGAVNTSTTPKVQYGYASGSANTIRPTAITYPNGRIITYDYGTADGYLCWRPFPNQRGPARRAGPGGQPRSIPPQSRSARGTYFLRRREPARKA